MLTATPSPSPDPSQTASSANPAVDPLHSFADLFTGLVTKVIDAARGQLEDVLQSYVFRTVDTSSPGGHPLTDNATLHSLTQGVALAADALIVVVVLVTALRSIADPSVRSRYDLRLLVPRLLLAAALVNFSMPLVQMAIDLDNALCSVFRGLAGGMSNDQLPWSSALSSQSVHNISASNDLFVGLFVLAVVVALSILVLVYVLRYALLCVLVVAAPAAAVLTALPETRGYARAWMRLLTTAVFMQAVQLLVLRVAAGLAFDSSGKLIGCLYALATLYIMLKVPGALNAASHAQGAASVAVGHVERIVRRAAGVPLPAAGRASM